MASGASAAAPVVVFAILVLSFSLGHTETTGGPCSYCASQCTMDCTTQITTTCGSYCENPLAARQACEKQVFQACTVSSCCYSNCSRDCKLVAQNVCKCVHDTTIQCESCRGRILQSCPAACNSNCNSTCVKK